MLREKLFSFKGDIFSFGMTVWEMLVRQQVCRVCQRVGPLLLICALQPYSGPKHRLLNKAQFEEIRERGELPGTRDRV
jgi:hypothetical protein